MIQSLWYARPRWQRITIGVFLAALILGTTIGPAIEIEGNWKRRVDPQWIEGLATFWALAGAVLIVAIEIGRDRRTADQEQERFLGQVAGAFVTWEHVPAPDDPKFAPIRFDVIVTNHGLYPVADVSIMDAERHSAITIVESNPLGPGKESGAMGVQYLLNRPIAVEFRALANGRRYRRDTYGKIREIDL